MSCLMKIMQGIEQVRICRNATHRRPPSDLSRTHLQSPVETWRCLNKTIVLFCDP
jgi:hypothetical protein